MMLVKGFQGVTDDPETTIALVLCKVSNQNVWLTHMLTWL